jgi:hypothetical protein
VRSQRGCLDSLGSTTRRLLGLRAGLSGPPLSRGQAASRLGISGRRAARLERTGLRTLSVTCGGGEGGAAQSAPPRIARLTRAAPTLQPASFLPAASAPQLKPAVDLRKPHGRQAVQGTSSSSTPAPFDGGSGPGLALVLAICFATLAVLVLVALRRSVTGRPTAQPAVASAPAPPPPAVPTYDPAELTDAGWVGPSADTPQAGAAKPSAQRGTSRVARSATVVASSAVGFAVRELVRRRLGGRGRRR